MQKILYLLPLSLLLSCGLNKNDKQLDYLDINLNYPASMWEETLPLGNGRLGAMPDGGIAKETIVLNEESMWSGSEWDPSNPEAKKYLPEIRKKLLKGDNLAAEKLMQQHFTCTGNGGENPRYGCYQTLGRFEIDFSDMFEDTAYYDYSRRLSLNNAVANTEFKFNYRGKHAKFSREYFVSIPDNVIVVKLKTDGAPLQFSFGFNRSGGEVFYHDGNIATMSGMLDSGEPSKDGVKFFAKAMVSKRSDNEAIILISARTNYRQIINNVADNSDFEMLRGYVDDVLTAASKNIDNL